MTGEHLFIKMEQAVVVQPEAENTQNNEKPESRCQQIWTKIFNRSVVRSIALGQLLSLLICGTAVTSGLLQQQGVQIPTAQSFLNYVLLGLVYAPVLACRSGEDSLCYIMRHRGWKYLLLAAVDVEANYMIVKAYHYTTVTSVQLLDCFTIPTVLALSCFFLRVRYKWLHIVGVFVCVLGIGALILADVFVNKYDGEGSNKLVGDLLCLGGAMLYGVSNVCQEYVVRSFNRCEFLGMLGIFASIINGVQFAVLERNEVASIPFGNYEVVLPLLGFAACLFTLYSLMPIVIEYTSATAVNLNLLSADFYALLVGLLVFKDQFHVLYLLSFGLIIFGIILYSIKPPPIPPADDEYQRMRIDGNEAPSAGGYQASATDCHLPGVIVGQGQGHILPGSEVLNGGSSVLYSKQRHNSSTPRSSRLHSGGAGAAEDESFLINETGAVGGVIEDEGEDSMTSSSLVNPQTLRSLSSEEYGQRT